MPSLVSRETIRASLHGLIDAHSPADALAHYYLFHHPVPRVKIYAYISDDHDRAEGFMLSAQTGMDLFRPLVTFRTGTESTAQSLFQAALPPGRPVYLSIPLDLAQWANKYLTVTEAELHRIYRLDARYYRSIINVLAVTSRGSDGTPRCEIRSKEGPGAVAGVNWQSPYFAEIFVHTDFPARGLGWGRSVVSCVAGAILSSRRTPLYIVSDSNQASINIAEAVGFVDTGLREYVAQAIRHE